MTCVLEEVASIRQKQTAQRAAPSLPYMVFQTPHLSHLSLQEKCAQYWPSDGVVSYGDITVELKKEEECESYTVRDLLVTNTRVRWLGDAAPPAGKSQGALHL